jgi:hypothetical protein
VSLNFNNGFAEHKFFDLRIENITDARCRVRMIVPKLTLQDEFERSLIGFRPIEMGPRELGLIMESALRSGTMSDEVAGVLKAMGSPSVLEVGGQAAGAELRGVLIPPGEQVRAVFTIEPPAELETPPVHFDVTQYSGRRLVGGSEFILRARTSSRPKPPQRLRIVLDRVQILDDHDPWILGKGEFVFTSQVLVDGDPVKGSRVRIPESGYISISDRPSHNIIELNEPVFDGCVSPGEQLTMSLLGTELDKFMANDETTRYRRTFTGEPETWIGLYRPDDEARDPENMRDWRVWYHIERG